MEGSAHASGDLEASESPYALMQQMGRALAMVEAEYVEPVDRAKLLGGGIEGMVAALDPHCSYMSPTDFAMFQNDLQGQFGGVGIEVDLHGEVLTVLAPIEGSPAALAGVKSGDEILGVNGEATQGTVLEKIVRKMRGAPGTHVRLTLRRKELKELLTVDLARAIIHVHSVDEKLLANGVGYVRIKQFQEHTHDELLAAVARLRREAKGPLRGVVLDLRADPGGFVDEASAVADELLTGGTIYTARHRGKVVDEVKASSGGALADVPTAVLVNEWTASASEIVAGALQDQKRATIVGTRTFGKGSVQSIFELPGGAGMRITTQRYYTPSGRAIQADGVHPDVEVRDAASSEVIVPLREGDLEGHLAAEQRGDAGVRAAPVVVQRPAGTGREASAEAAAKTPAAPRGHGIDDVPFDPSKGDDEVLRVGYAVVRGEKPQARSAPAPTAPSLPAAR